jgi:hypothetical protein
LSSEIQLGIGFRERESVGQIAVSGLIYLESDVVIRAEEHRYGVALQAGAIDGAMKRGLEHVV